ncbi:MAG TPA: DUF6644 family protein [Terriglobia bacterium]|nr:DUF6644 family protein [Terriglobia bacterium]
MGLLVAGAEGVMMSVTDVLTALESSHLADRIRISLYLFPLLESFHVLGLATVFGTIAIIDLRLLGLASTRRPFTRIASDVLKWTWAAFALTATTGFLMFITNADVYYHNFFFRSKMALLALAGLNMLIFELTAGRSVHAWDKDKSAPRAARAAAVLSLVVWITIIFMGRWIGFTTSHSQAKPDSDINLEDIFPK